MFYYMSELFSIGVTYYNNGRFKVNHPKQTIMKRILFLVLVLVSFTASAQWPWERIDGNGKMTKQTRSVGNYTAVSSAGFWDVMVGYGEGSTITVEGDENLLEFIETVVENNKLVIKTKGKVNLRSRNKVTVYVSLTRLTGISLSGSGNIMGQGKFRNEGTSVFHLSGSGNINMDVDKLGGADISLSGSGNLILGGSANTVTAKISGSGNVDCSDLISDDATVRVSGSGGMKLNANKSVDASISGSGSVSYKGAATDIRKHVSGSGRLSKS